MIATKLHIWKNDFSKQHRQTRQVIITRECVTKCPCYHYQNYTVLRLGILTTTKNKRHGRENFYVRSIFELDRIHVVEISHLVCKEKNPWILHWQYQGPPGDLYIIDIVLSDHSGFSARSGMGKFLRQTVSEISNRNTQTYICPIVGNTTRPVSCV